MAAVRRPMLALALAAASPAAGQPPVPASAVAQPDLVVARPAAQAEHPGALVVPKDTMVRLMVLNEVNTHDAKPGDTFVLRVDEAVAVDGVTIVPVGAKAWGEVTEVKENKALGKAGRIGARLLYLEVMGERIPLAGEDSSKGTSGSNRVVMAAAGFGPFGLLARGSQGKLKAGHIFNGYLARDVLYERENGRLVVPPEAAPAPANP